MAEKIEEIDIFDPWDFLTFALPIKRCDWQRARWYLLKAVVCYSKITEHMIS